MHIDINEVINWLNLNTGVLAVILFVVSLILGWLSGIFRFLIHKPKIIIEEYSTSIPNFYVNEGLNLSCKTLEGQKVSRTVFFVSVSISNIGFTDTSIKSYKFIVSNEAGKKDTLIPMSLPTPLTVSLGNKEKGVKVFPSLTTNYPHLGHNKSWDIKVGESNQGFLYFNIEYYGNYAPKHNSKYEIRSKLIIEDIYGKKYKKTIVLVKKDSDYLSRFIDPQNLINEQSYADFHSK